MPYLHTVTSNSILIQLHNFKFQYPTDSNYISKHLVTIWSKYFGHVITIMQPRHNSGLPLLSNCFGYLLNIFYRPCKKITVSKPTCKSVEFFYSLYLWISYDFKSKANVGLNPNHALQIITAQLQPIYSQMALIQFQLQSTAVHSQWQQWLQPEFSKSQSFF